MNHVPFEGASQALPLNGSFQNRLGITQVLSAREVSIVALGADADHWLGAGQCVYPTTALVNSLSTIFATKELPLISKSRAPTAQSK
jgi:hypothetical protein